MSRTWSMVRTSQRYVSGTTVLLCRTVAHIPGGHDEFEAYKSCPHTDRINKSTRRHIAQGSPPSAVDGRFGRIQLRARGQGEREQGTLATRPHFRTWYTLRELRKDEAYLVRQPLLPVATSSTQQKLTVLVAGRLASRRAQSIRQCPMCDVACVGNMKRYSQAHRRGTGGRAVQLTPR